MNKPRFVTLALKNHKIIRKDLISISLIVLIRNLIFHKHFQFFIKWKIFISPFHYSLSTLFHPPSFPIIASPYHGYDNETYTTVRGMIEGMIAQNEGMMGMAGTSNTWKLMVCSLPSCCFVAMQRRQERL